MVHPLQLQATLSCNPRFPVNCYYRQLESSLQACKANICETFETWMSLIFLSSLFSSVLQDAFPERNLLNADPRENVLANKIVLCSFSRQARLEREAAERAAAASASSSRRRRKGPNQNKNNKKKKEDIFWIYSNWYRFNTFYLWLSDDILLISCIFLLLYINETNKNKTFFLLLAKICFNQFDVCHPLHSMHTAWYQWQLWCFFTGTYNNSEFRLFFSLPVRPEWDKKKKAGSQISRFAARNRGCFWCTWRFHEKFRIFFMNDLQFSF